MRKDAKVWLIVFSAIIFSASANFAEAHLIGTNVVTKQVGSYEVRFLMFPFAPDPEEPVLLQFSVLDENGYNIDNVQGSVKVQKADSTIYTSPKVRYVTSDFYISYTFPEKGDYKVILEIDIPNGQVVVADFAVKIGETKEEQLAMFIAGGGAVGGGLTIFFVRYLKSHKRSNRSLH
ncbi:MAG: hypothetical protein QXU32_12925 [Nitrososphaerales archaeon]